MSASTRADLADCRAILARGSKSFALASLVLPRRVRDPAAAFYAFCRVADDAIDDTTEPGRGLDRLRTRLDRIVSGRPEQHPVDRALSQVMADRALPRAPFDALLEGFAWDVAGRRYEDLSGVLSYSARVAGTVGVVMTLLMGKRDPGVLARACDLGVAMQLSNIARDVGEDARRGRVYLPLAWLEEHHVSPGALAESASDGARASVARLLDHADQLYARADLGVAMLPRDCRAAIRAARLVYSDLGRVIRRAEYDTVSSRLYVSTPRKLWLLARAMSSVWSVSRGPQPRDPPALSEAEFLIEVPS